MITSGGDYDDDEEYYYYDDYGEEEHQYDYAEYRSPSPPLLKQFCPRISQRSVGGAAYL